MMMQNKTHCRQFFSYIYSFVISWNLISGTMMHAPVTIIMFSNFRDCWMLTAYC